MPSEFYAGDCPACGARVGDRKVCQECGFNVATAAGVDAEQARVEGEERRWLRAWPRRRSAEILGVVAIIYFIAQIIQRT
jgi:uncharacterized membrane protein YvbJ